MTIRRIWMAAFLALIVVIAAVGSLWWWLANRTSHLYTPTSNPPPAFTPPSSLEDLAQDYPELADLLTNSKLDSVYKEFLVAYQRSGLEAAEDLARRRGLLNSQNELCLILVLDTDEPELLLTQLQTIGVRVENYYRDLVAVAIPLPRAVELAEAKDPGAVFRQLVELQHIIEVRLPESPVPQARVVQGEGVAVIGADDWHQADYTGQGIKVAILDGAFEGYEALLGRELPDHVVYQSFGQDDDMDERARFHGTACAEIVHEVAPDAELYLVTFEGNIGFDQAVEWLIAQNVDIVSHSAGWLAGPRDGTSRQAQAVDKAQNAGILWVNSAGNYAERHYAAPFRDTDGNGLHEFSLGQEELAFSLKQPDKVSIALNWDDWPRSDQNLDLYLLDDAGNVLASSQNIQDGTKRPVEWILYELGSANVYYLVVQAVDTTRVVHLDLFINEGTLQQAVPNNSLSIPADALGALAVGATFWEDDILEPFSSRGPTSDGRTKPGIVAPNGVKGVSYNHFFGTSAAAPHVAGAAALVLSAFPDASPGDVVAYLQERAIDLGSPGVDNLYGTGRLALGPPSSVSPIEPPTETPASVTTTDSPPISTDRPTPLPTASPADEIVCLSSLLILALGLGLLGLVALATRSIVRHCPRLLGDWVPSSPKRHLYCKQCNQPQRPGARFCARCGTILSGPVNHCPHCGQQIYSDQARFCGYCGCRL